MNSNNERSQTRAPAIHRRFRTALAPAVLAVAVWMTAATGSALAEPTAGELLASGLEGSIGGAIGPDGALYVPEGAVGEITRIDPATGATSTYASGLPPAPFGGAIDVAFIGSTAYALVTLVAPDAVVGIYRMDGPDSFTVVADVGAFSEANLPPYPVDVPTGLQYALEPEGDGFLVSDGHHNRILRVALDGTVEEFIAMENVVPTGLATSGTTIYTSLTGPVPHTPADGQVVSLDAAGSAITPVASGLSLMVDVEVGPGGVLYGLSQGDSPGDVAPASPALPDSGRLVRVGNDGTFASLVEGINLPTTLEFVGDTAFIVTLGGEVWKVENVSQLQTATPTATSSPTAAAAPTTPTTTATAVPGAPTAGSGDDDAGNRNALWIGLGVVGLFVLTAGTLAARRRLVSR